MTSSASYGYGEGGPRTREALMETKPNRSFSVLFVAQLADRYKSTPCLLHHRVAAQAQ